MGTGIGVGEAAGGILGSGVLGEKISDNGYQESGNGRTARLRLRRFCFGEEWIHHRGHRVHRDGERGVAPLNLRVNPQKTLRGSG